MSRDSISNELPNLSPASSADESFTMIFLDFDDTIIPSKFYRLFSQDLNVDIFSLFSKSHLKELQNTIIDTIQHLQKQYASNSEAVHFCVVSNGSQKWLDYVFKGSKEYNVPSYLPLLDKFFAENDISIISASAKAYEFLQRQFGAKADSIFSKTLDTNKDNRWMWKYTSFASIISDYKRETGMKCGRIISVGDGTDEERAVRHYTDIHHRQSLHIRFMRGPTFVQIIEQWKYLKDTLYGDRLVKANGDDEFQLFDLQSLDRFECDNNGNCTGKSHQLSAIRIYFKLWMQQLNDEYTKSHKQNAIKRVCTAIHGRMYGMDPKSKKSRNFKLILIRAICKDKEFNDIFNAYYRKVQRKLDERNKLEKDQQISV